MIIKAFPDNQQLNPRNIDDLGFIKDFRLETGRVSLDFTDLVLVNKDYERLFRWIYQEQGRFENVAATVETSTGVQYPHYLDLKTAKWTNNQVTVGMQSRKGTDHFMQDAENLIWKVVYNDGFIPASAVREVPYVIVPSNIKLERAIAIITTMSLLDQFNRALFEIEKLIADGLDVAGTGLLTALAKAVALAIHFALVVVALISTFNRLRELYFPTLRFLQAVSDYDLIKAGCEKLGYTFESNELFQNQDICTMGKPLAQEGKGFLTFFQNDVSATFFNYPYPTSEDSCPTLWSLIDHYLTKYKWKIFVYDGVVKLEPKAFFQNAATQTIKPAYTNQGEREPEKEFYNEDIFGRRYVTWATDFSDMHSPDSNLGSRAEEINNSLNPINPDLVSLTGLDEERINFAWAGRKDGLTKIEQLIADVFSFVDSVINIFGGNSNYAAAIESRVGVMVIEKEYFEVTKKLYLKQVGGLWKQPSDYQEVLSADKIVEDYYEPLTSYTVQQYRVPYTQEKFEELLQNNFVNLPSGTTIEVLEVNWKDRKYAATFTVLEPDNSAFNTETIKLT